MQLLVRITHELRRLILAERLEHLGEKPALADRPALVRAAVLPGEYFSLKAENPYFLLIILDELPSFFWNFIKPRNEYFLQVILLPRQSVQVRRQASFDVSSIGCECQLTGRAKPLRS
jgi:hypothetical protein